MHREKWASLKTILAAALISLLLAGCSDPEDARRALAREGYTGIKTDGYRFKLSFWCGKIFIRTGFTAVSPEGKPVSGIVCDGLFCDVIDLD